MKMFSVDLLIASTLYITAESEEEALEKIKKITGSGIEFSNRRQAVSEDLHVTGETYSPDMPSSLSPAMTILAAEDQNLHLNLVEDFGSRPNVGDVAELRGTDVRITIDNVDEHQPRADEGIFIVYDEDENQHNIQRADDGKWTINTIFN